MACATKHYNWRADIGRLVHRTLNRFPELSANTYIDHPWPGWDHLSVDFWSVGGCGYPIRGDAPNRARAFLFRQPGLPNIRHCILDHDLWTSYGGYSYWRPNDHTGRERHLHVTYWR